MTDIDRAFWRSTRVPDSLIKYGYGIDNGRFTNVLIDYPYLVRIPILWTSSIEISEQKSAEAQAFLVDNAIDFRWSQFDGVFFFFRRPGDAVAFKLAIA